MNSNILTTLDKSQIPPLHQKRILAFVNHFVISSCSFLNDFASKCESKFIEVERKIQKVEASLIIIESKLSSIPDLCEKKETQAVLVEKTTETNEEIVHLTDDSTSKDLEIQDPVPEEKGVKACEDVRYKKFFKMIQVGVPINAVKMKMQAEGFDATIIETPDLVLLDGTIS